MNRENLPVILTDIDGVAIQWQSGLPYFAQKYNLPLEHILNVIIEDKFIPPSEIFDCHKDLADKLIKKYNSSDFIRYLAPYADALAIINKLKLKYRFVAVTALGTDVDSLLNRKFNLQALFPGAFEDIFVCGHDESKSVLFRKAKEKYGDDIVAYIDDMPHHVEAAHEVLDCPIFWMPRGPRESPPDCQHRKIKDWNDFEWSLQLSLPIVPPSVWKRDEITLHEMMEELNKASKHVKKVDDEFIVPLNENDFFKPMTPCDPPYPNNPWRPWANYPRWPENSPRVVPDYVLLNKVTANDSDQS